MIHVDRLTYNYPHAAAPALADVSLHVRPGEFVLLAGPSGAGKSTLLRCFNGLVPHFSGGRIAGSVLVSGVNVTQAGPKVASRLVGFVNQTPEAQHVLDTVEAEIAFGLENAAVPPAEMRHRVEEVLHLLHLDHLRGRPLATLSGGEQQRVALAAALALQPPVLALDEPTSQLDPEGAAGLLAILIRLNRRHGLTVILAEHRLERVERAAERLMVLEGGKIAYDGRPMTDDRPTTNDRRPTIGHLDGVSPILEASGIHYAYGRTPILNGASLCLMPGEAVALMGRNGAGKTTLLKCLVGLLRPSQGEVTIAGRSTRGRSVAEISREVAYLPQNPDDLLFAESVTAEVETTLHNHGLNTEHWSLNTGKLLSELGLALVADAYPRDLSVGQRQRVALAAVTITEPHLLLLDEPTRGLDYETKAALAAVIRRWLERGAAVLVATHDQTLVSLLAHRVLVLDEGKVVADGLAQPLLL